MRRISILLLIFFTCCVSSAWPQAQHRRHKITTFDAPGSGTGAGQGTTSSGSNAAGVIAGYYIDANGVSHGFLRRGDDE